ncbi:MAG: CRISPR system precrRNA processing endoribonuclease RAMP protein Cas6 [Acidobacteriaceae bacterium]|nr:CRISPR system precrRNA processing endoribonuclease RAMP protein Cas6 [Acidobacteriaceae bacterium]
MRFSFVARQPVHFPPGKPANLLRGAFGMIFRRIACVQHCPGAVSCDLRAECPYARMFEPRATAQGPSGLVDWPRPFVFRATHLDGRTVLAGENFFFDLNLFDMRSPAIAYLVLAFAQLSREGLGPGRGRAELTEVFARDENGEPATRIYDGKTFLLQNCAEPLVLNLEAPHGGQVEQIERVRVRFVTPTELKAGQHLAERPEFGVLIARIRDRLSTLRELYDSGPLEIDFRAFGERATRVRMVRCDIEQVDVRRRSSRTGQVHPIGGFIGEAEYEGELTEFVPYLRAAQWTGVGRQTVWGKGEMKLQL